MNYYCDMWERQFHTIEPLTDLTYSKKKSKWTDIYQKAFNKIKRIVDRNNLLANAYINKIDIHKGCIN